VVAGSNTSTVALRVVGGDERGNLESETVKYGRSPKGLGPENDYTGEGQQQFRMTDPSPRPRGRPTTTKCSCLTVTTMWIWSPAGCLTPRQTGRLTIGRKHNLELQSSPCGGSFEYLHYSPASRWRRRKGNPMPGVTTGSPYSWGI
jgi:hypothetical protein